MALDEARTKINEYLDSAEQELAAARKEAEQAKADDAADDAKIAAQEVKIAELMAEVARLQDIIDSGQTPEEPPPPADKTPKITDLVGCRIFPHYKGKTYSNHDALFSWIKDSGLQRITGLLSIDTPNAALDFYKRLNTELGVKMWFTIGKPRQEFDDANWNTIKNKMNRVGGAKAIEQVASWNEPNHMRNSNDIPLDNWHKKSGEQQRELWNLAHPMGIDVATPQLWSGNMADHEADLRLMAPYIDGYYDVIAWHLYPRGGVGASLVENFYRLYYNVLGKHRVCCTEAGYFDAAKYKGNARPVTQAEAGKYIGPHIRLYTDRGDRFGGFEFLNDPDPTQAYREANLGWINTPSLDPKTWSAKPIYNSVKKMLAAA